jgi:hypothetical protein
MVVGYLNIIASLQSIVNLFSLAGVTLRVLLARPDQTACIPVDTGSIYTCCTHI